MKLLREFMHKMFKLSTGKTGHNHIQSFLRGEKRGFCVRAESEGKAGYLVFYHGLDKRGWKFSQKLASKIKSLISEGHPVWVYSCYSAYCSNPPTGGFAHLTKIPVKYTIYEETGYVRVHQ